ncbi:hypothetical protein D0C36_10175 [Mucilaginibacter conchicola]|uniref:Uncharacterized protein n=1 Tax=Mucilaginibacter conchicola TaxID=2303333 RepID=A0A372NRB3_9SPHI|nr:hypothetical protein D0C36_10175 [Mucilaginibacter conchicola]
MITSSVISILFNIYAQNHFCVIYNIIKICDIYNGLINKRIGLTLTKS